MSSKDKYGGRTGGTEPVCPNLLVRMGMATALALFVFFAVVFFAPWLFMGGEEPANPLVTPENIKPEWYFLALYQSLKLFSADYLDVERLVKIIPNSLCEVVAPGILLGLLLLLPFWERTRPKPLRARRVFLALVALGVLSYIAMTVWGKLS